MASLRFLQDRTLREVTDHLFAGPGERFVFLLCRWQHSTGDPALVAADAILMDPADVAMDGDGWSLSDRALDDVLNRAAATGLALVEAHNHAYGPPRFSNTDRAGLEPFANYVLDSFPEWPYGATVWTDQLVYGEWFGRNDDGETATGVLDRIVLVGPRLQVLTAADAKAPHSEIVDRQLAVFGVTGQQTLGQLRVGIVGLGGTGSHMAQNLAYLGARDFVLIDQDRVEVTNLNRLVTATHDDEGSPKVATAKRAICSIAPSAAVEVIEAAVTSEDDSVARSLAVADLIIGCVDNDGPRLLLNRISLAHQVPYLDVATGIAVDEGETIQAGGRVAFTVPRGPCLACTGEIDVNEVRSYFLTEAERQRAQRHGYLIGDDTPDPAVVSLNGLVVHVALNELTLWIAGVRPPAHRTDIDLLGNDKPFGPRVTPRRGVSRRDDCIECGIAAAVTAG